VVKEVSDERRWLLDALKAEFVPNLRRLGFKGTGNRFTRLRSPFIDCVWLWTYNRQIRIEVALHTTFWPTVLGKTPDVKRLHVADCDFRKTIAPPTRGGFGWSYGESPEQSSRTVMAMARAYEEKGETTLAKFQTLPGPFALITEADVDSGIVKTAFDWQGPVRVAMRLAQMYEYLGQPTKALAFARAGLRNLGQATRLKEPLEEIESRCADRV